jgi:hypothetical protein
LGSDRTLVAAVVLLTAALASTAGGQGLEIPSGDAGVPPDTAAAPADAPATEEPPPPVDTPPVPATEPAPSTEASPAPGGAPSTETSPAPGAAPTSGKPTVTVTREPYRDRGLVAGIELGIAHVSGTSATVYGLGRGAGFVVGYHLDWFLVELHLLESYALAPKDDQLRGETTQGAFSSTSLLARARVLRRPMLEVMAGPALLSTPLYVIGKDLIGANLIEANDMNGVGLIAGASAGYRINQRVAVSLDLRAVLAASWELPGHAYVVPGGIGPNGGRMYTTSDVDATGGAWTATVLLRLMP